MPQITPGLHRYFYIALSATLEMASATLPMASRSARSTLPGIQIIVCASFSALGSCTPSINFCSGARFASRRRAVCVTADIQKKRPVYADRFCQPYAFLRRQPSGTGACNAPFSAVESSIASPKYTAEPCSIRLISESTSALSVCVSRRMRCWARSAST